MDNPFKFLGLGVLLAIFSLFVPAMFSEAVSTELSRGAILVLYAAGVLTLTVSILLNTQRLKPARALKNK